jgi:hypothetical protein
MASYGSQIRDFYHIYTEVVEGRLICSSPDQQEIVRDFVGDFSHSRLITTQGKI